MRTGLLFVAAASMLVSGTNAQFGSGLLYCFNNPTEQCCQIYGLAGPCCDQYPNLYQCAPPPPTPQPVQNPTQSPTPINLDPKELQN